MKVAMLTSNTLLGRNRVWILAVFSLVLLAVSVGTAPWAIANAGGDLAAPDENSTPPAQTDIGIEPALAAAARLATTEPAQVVSLQDRPGESPSVTLTPVVGREQARDLITKEANNPSTLAVDLNGQVSAMAVAAQPDEITPPKSDPMRYEQWALDAMCIDAQAAAVNPDCAGQYAHQIADGTGEIVAVLDTQIDYGLADLQDLLRTGGTCLDEPVAGGVVTCRFVTEEEKAQQFGLADHGSHVASIVSAQPLNNIGIAGVAPGAQLLPVTVLKNDNSGSFAGVAQGIIWAVDQGATVINLSLGYSSRNAVVEAAVQYALRNNVSVVAAAGNNQLSLPGQAFYPASYPGVISVGASTREGPILPQSQANSEVDVVAPGEGIRSLCPTGEGCDLTGTSMAAPHIAGLVALIRQIEPQLNVAQVHDRITSSAKSLAGGTRTHQSGYGFAWPIGALQPSLEFVPINPERMYDSRTGQRINAGSQLYLDQIAQQIPDEARAIAFNLTATETRGSGWIALVPGHMAKTATSTINWDSANQSIANSFVVATDSLGGVKLIAGGAGSTHAIIDVLGYYVPHTSPTISHKFTALSPARAYDSRDHGQIPSSGSSVQISLAEVGVPQTATAVTFTLTAVDTVRSGWMAVNPAGEQVSTSTINWTQSGQIIANSSQVTLSDRELRIVLGGGGASHFVIDVTGYFQPDQDGADTETGRYRPMWPSRLVDSREPGKGGVVASGQARAISLIPASQVPADAQAVTVNVTVADTRNSGFLAVVPPSTSATVSTINWFRSGQILANGGTVPFDRDGAWQIRSGGSGSTQAIFDISGYYIAG